ncbi:unnamed protein product, partial [Scytosiphon promiscuus]
MLQAKYKRARSHRCVGTLSDVLGLAPAGTSRYPVLDLKRLKSACPGGSATCFVPVCLGWGCLKDRVRKASRVPPCHVVGFHSKYPACQTHEPPCLPSTSNPTKR